MKGSVRMAVINVTALTDITGLIASDRVSPGDVLLLEDGLYFQTVNITKDNIRIIAKGKNAVFYGMGILFNAFILSDVTGVEINGITIPNYSISGILIDFGSGNRIVNNKIYIENTVKNCYGDGFHSFREQDSDNVFVGNTAIGNRGYGMSIQGTNNLLLNNTLIDNGSGGVIIGEGSNTVGINNTVKDSRVTGYFVFNHDNSFTIPLNRSRQFVTR